GGRTTINGRVARGETGLVADNLRIGNERVELTADGTFASQAADFDYALTLSDLALITEQAQGRLEANGRASGTDGVIALTTIASIPQGRLAGKPLSQAQLTFDGTLQGSTLDGTLGGDAFLEGIRVQLAAGVGVADGTQRLTDLDFSAGGARVTGSLARGPTGLIDGDLAVDAADISTAAALALVEATGAVDATINLSSTQEGRQNAQAQATVRALRIDQTQLDSAEIEATVEDLFNVPAIDGT